MILLGFAIVAVPMLLGVLSAASQMNRLAQSSEALVQQGVEATGRNQQLAEQLSSLERSARYYQVLGDAESLRSYRERQLKFLELLDVVAELPTDETGHRRLETMRTLSVSIAVELERLAPGSEALTDTLDKFDQLDVSAAVLVADGNLFIDDGLHQLQEDAKASQRLLALQTGLLLPAVLGLSLLFTYFIARPIRAIDHAISALGQGAFSKPIAVSGPRDLEALGRQLEWLREHLLDQAREKNKFLRHMSHELKTPLANIREGTELLMDGAVGELQEPQREVAGILRDNGVALQKLIENLLSFSTWQSKLSELEYSQFKLGDLVRTVLHYQRLAIEGKELSIRHELSGLEVDADQGKLRMVLDNLISNAVKYSPAGGQIAVRVSQRGNEAWIEIADQGPGIPESEHDRVFEAFFQGSVQHEGHVRGTGIGLSVVMECVHAHGGSVEIVEGEFSGAHFRVRLPMRRVEQRA